LRTKLAIDGSRVKTQALQLPLHIADKISIQFIDRLACGGVRF
jgi:hypothetical protein